MSFLSSILNPSSSNNIQNTNGSTKDVESTATVTGYLSSKINDDANTTDEDITPPPTSVTELLMQNSNAVKPRAFDQESHSLPGNGNSKKGALHSAVSSPDSDTFRGSYQTLLINARSRHLKKNDSEPYWRNEIQFEFLMKLFFNHSRVFTNPYFETPEGFDWPDHFKFYKDENGNFHSNNGKLLTFFELYLITLLKSSKISKILKARLMLDINYALNFAIICLLVNIGRLNTTVNFDYEMRSQFRTYHSIPSLQVGNHLTIIESYYRIHETSSSDGILDDTGKKSLQQNNSKNSVTRNGSGYTMATVKQLQDTPRIKSILKSVNDLSGKIPKTYAESISEVANKDNTFNVVSIIFMICSHEYDIGKAFFPFDQIDQSKFKTSSTGSLLNDIWLRPKFKSDDKVRRFLWLMYTLLESKLDISKMINNPFNNKSDKLPNFGDDHQYNDLSKVDLARELIYINHKTTDISPIILKLKDLIPNWKIIDPLVSIDPKINDFDTEQEVEFASEMKRLRNKFVQSETQLKPKYVAQPASLVSANDLGEEAKETEPLEIKPILNKPQVTLNNRVPEILPNTHNAVIRTKTLRFSQIKAKSIPGGDEFAYKFYHPRSKTNPLTGGVKDQDDNDDIRSDLDNENNYHTDYELDFHQNNIHASADEDDDDEIYYTNTDENSDIENDDDRDYTENDNIMNFISKKRQRDQSIESAATDPLYLSNYEENDSKTFSGCFNYGYPGMIVKEDNGNGSMILTSCVKKRKTRKTIYVEPPMKLTHNKLEIFLNKDNKSLHSGSRNAILKREKNRALAEFLLELIEFKQSQHRDRRNTEGNWLHFMKYNYDLNLLIEKELSTNDVKYGDWGEFKTTMAKVFNKVNYIMNARMEIEKSEKYPKVEYDQSSFIDDIFNEI